jgi:hypothetical protein
MDDSLRDPPAPIYTVYTYSCLLLFGNYCYFTDTDNYHVNILIYYTRGQPNTLLVFFFRFCLHYRTGECSTDSHGDTKGHSRLVSNYWQFETIVMLEVTIALVF